MTHLSVLLGLVMRRAVTLKRAWKEYAIGGGSEVGIVLVYTFALKGAAMAVLGPEAVRYIAAGMLGAQAFQTGIARGATNFIARDVDFFLSTPTPRFVLTAGLLSGDLFERSVISWMQVIGVSFVVSFGSPYVVLLGCLASTLVLATGMAFGLALSALLKDSFTLVRVLTFLMLPQSIICGAYFPTVDQGQVISTLRLFLPVEYAVDLFHRIFATGYGKTYPDGELLRHTTSTNIWVLVVLGLVGISATSLWIDRLRGRGDMEGGNVNN